jgi:carbamoyl-phosphate synthase large subunit
MLGIYGHAVFQLIQSSTGGLHVIECNARFGGASTLSIAAGLDSFYWFLLEACGDSLSQYPFARCRRELRQIRFARDLVIDHE